MYLILSRYLSSVLFTDVLFEHVFFVSQKNVKNLLLNVKISPLIKLLCSRAILILRLTPHLSVTRYSGCPYLESKLWD